MLLYKPFQNGWFINVYYCSTHIMLHEALIKPPFFDTLFQTKPFPEKTEKTPGFGVSTSVGAVMSTGLHIRNWLKYRIYGVTSYSLGWVEEIWASLKVKMDLFSLIFFCWRKKVRSSMILQSRIVSESIVIFVSLIGWSLFDWRPGISSENSAILCHPGKTCQTRSFFWGYWIYIYI